MFHSSDYIISLSWEKKVRIIYFSLFGKKKFGLNIFHFLRKKVRIIYFFTFLEKKFCSLDYIFFHFLGKKKFRSSDYIFFTFWQNKVSFFGLYIFHFLEKKFGLYIFSLFFGKKMAKRMKFSDDISDYFQMTTQFERVPKICNHFNCV